MVPRKLLTFLFIFSYCKESKIFYWFITAQISHHLANKTEADGSLILHSWALQLYTYVSKNCSSKVNRLWNWTAQNQLFVFSQRHDFFPFIDKTTESYFQHHFCLASIHRKRNFGGSSWWWSWWKSSWTFFKLCNYFNIIFIFTLV